MATETWMYLDGKAMLWEEYECVDVHIVIFASIFIYFSNIYVFD